MRLLTLPLLIIRFIRTRIQYALKRKFWVGVINYDDTIAIVYSRTQPRVFRYLLDGPYLDHDDALEAMKFWDVSLYEAKHYKQLYEETQAKDQETRQDPLGDNSWRKE